MVRGSGRPGNENFGAMTGGISATPRPGCSLVALAISIHTQSYLCTCSGEGTLHSQQHFRFCVVWEFQLPCGLFIIVDASSIVLENGQSAVLVIIPMQHPDPCADHLRQLRAVGACLMLPAMERKVKHSQTSQTANTLRPRSKFKRACIVQHRS